jgi:hypothetical protein
VECDLGSHFVGLFALKLINQKGGTQMKSEYINESANCAGSEDGSAAHYSAAAARARKLHAEATTPRMKQYLQELIAKCEGLAKASN